MKASRLSSSGAGFLRGPVVGRDALESLHGGVAIPIVFTNLASALKLLASWPRTLVSASIAARRMTLSGPPPPRS